MKRPGWALAAWLLIGLAPGAALAAPTPAPSEAATVQAVMAAAGRGDVRAQVTLADRYMTGRGVKRSVADALHWYGRAAEHGDGEAFYMLGAIHRKGGRPDKAYACFLLAGTFATGDLQRKARAAAASLAPRLSAVRRRDAEELATGWRLTIDR